MITTVTLNAAIDKTYFVPRFPLGKVTRTAEPYVSPGGKGLNVARVIRQLGCESAATGFLAGMNGRSIEYMLTKQGIAHDFAFTEEGGESRLCLTVIDEATGQATELIEPGPCICAKDLDVLRDKIQTFASRSDLIIFSGSIPRGVPHSIYQELITLAQEAGCQTLLDASGEALVQGIEACPFLIKPNEHEITELLGKRMEDEEELYPLIDHLNKKGIACVVVSLGAAGCLAGYKGQLLRASAPSISAVNTVGCGDSFIAGLAVGLVRNEPIELCLQRAVAAGTADALTPEAGHVDTEVVNNLLQEISVISL